MPPPERKGHKNYAMLWVASGFTRDGRPKVMATPVEIRVRWEEGEDDRMAPDGQRIVVDVVIQASRDIPIGSVMWQGTQAALTALGGTPTTDIFEVVTRDVSPDLKARDTAYEYGLKRYQDTMPTSA